MDNFLHNRILDDINKFALCELSYIGKLDTVDIVAGRGNVTADPSSTVTNSTVLGKLVVGKNSRVSGIIVGAGCTLVVGDDCTVVRCSFGVDTDHEVSRDYAVTDGSTVAGCVILTKFMDVKHSVLFKVEALCSDARILLNGAMLIAVVMANASITAGTGTVLVGAQINGGLVNLGKNCLVGADSNTLFKGSLHMALNGQGFNDYVTVICKQLALSAASWRATRSQDLAVIISGNKPESTDLFLSVDDDAVILTDMRLIVDGVVAIGKRFRLASGRAKDKRYPMQYGRMEAYGLELRTGTVSIGNDVIWQTAKEGDTHDAIHIGSEGFIKTKSRVFGEINVASGTHVLQLSSIAAYLNCRVFSVPGSKLIL